MLTITTINGRSIDHVSLALAFATALHDELGEDMMKRVVQLNVEEKSEGVCHSHDFCDANVLMLEAIGKLCGLENEEAIHDAQLDADPDNKLWNDAWSLAKEAGFSTNIGTVANCYAHR